MITGGGGGSSTPAIAFGTAAARPAAAAANANTAYFATDTGELTVSNGAAWSAIAHVGGAFSAGGNISGNNVSATANISGGNDMNLQGSGLVAESGGVWNFQGVSLSVHSAGSGLRVAEGTNAKQGTATLVAGTVTVSNTSVTANSRILLTVQTPGGTVGAVYVSARTAGTSFTITSTSGTDTSTVAYEIIEPG